MRFESGSIERGMLPLLDIALLLFGIMIVIMIFAKIEENNDAEDDAEVSEVDIITPIQTNDNTKSETKKYDREKVINKLAKKLDEEKKIMFLEFDVYGIVRDEDGNIVLDEDFHLDAIITLRNRIERYNPIVVITYPNTGNRPNKATYEKVNRMKNEISKYSEIVAEISYKPDAEQ